MKKVYIYKAFGRFWHWAQAFLIIFLIFTGFEIHGSYTFFGFENAVHYHTNAAYSYIILIIFTIFWHFATGEWVQYVPTLTNLKKQAEYYLFGIFRNASHPTRKTQLSKLNPLQRLVYLGLKIILIPLMVFSGLLYLLYRFPQGDKINSIKICCLSTLGYIHTIGAFLLIAFLIAHLYLITTGHTIFSNLNAMITGYEEIDDDEDDDNVTIIDKEKVYEN